jgi:hypothetical protein
MVQVNAFELGRAMYTACMPNMSCGDFADDVISDKYRDKFNPWNDFRIADESPATSFKEQFNQGWDHERALDIKVWKEMNDFLSEMINDMNKEDINNGR